MQQPADESPPPRSTIQQWYSSTHLQRLATSQSLGWTHARLEIAQHDPVPEIAYSPYIDDDVFAFLLEGSAQMQMRISAGIMRNERVRPGTLQLLPRHTSFGGAWDATWTYGTLRLHQEMVRATSAELLRGDPDQIVLVPTYGFYDPLLYAFGTELTSEMRNASPLGPLYADSLANALIIYLLRHYSTGQVVGKVSDNRLTPIQLRRLNEFIHTHLEQKITLGDLAACLHLSVPHFERMFRVTTHRPPYRYVLEVRLEKAMTLLTTTRLSLAEIGLQCGFASQSHFTTHFRRRYGLSPARFLRGMRD